MQSDQLAKSGRWEVAPLKPMFSTEDQVLGIVGLGNIGQAVARKAQPFGFEILIHDPYLTPEVIGQFDAESVDIEALFTRSDVIALTAPHTDETHHMINEETLKKMKSSALVVNTSRGGLINEEALERGLKEGWIAGAGLDVMENEPVEASRPLLGSDKLIVTPHTAWYTEQAMVRMRRLACQDNRGVGSMARTPVVGAKGCIDRHDELGCGQQERDRHLGRRDRVVMQVVHGDAREVDHQFTRRVRQSSPGDDQRVQVGAGDQIVAGRPSGDQNIIVA